jgi:hypothetical protein
MGNLQVRFLEGWAPAMAPGYSTLGIISGLPVIREDFSQFAVLLLLAKILHE